MSDQTPGYKGVILIGSLQIPVMADPSLQAAENDVNPPIIGNWYESHNVAPGLIDPRVNFSFAIRDTPDEVLSPDFLDLFFSRTTGVEHETFIVPGGITFWDGRSGFQMNGVKADSLSIQMSKTGGPQISASFCASNSEGVDALVPLTAAPAFTAWDTTPLLHGQNLSFTGALQNEVWTAGLNLANNHRQNNCMNGSRYPADQNASMMMAGLQIMLRAATPEPVNYVPVNAQIKGTGFTRTIRIVRPKYQTPKNRNISLPENFRTYSAKCLGDVLNAPSIVYL